MKNNLGKIILLLCMTPYLLSAAVLLNAPDTFYKNEVVVFKIIAIGKDIKIPEIPEINGIPVQNTGTSQQTTIVNGDTSYQLVKSYAMVSNEDIEIPSFKINIDNKIEQTQKKLVKMIEVKKTKSDLYDLTISINKKSVYVGELVEFILKFKYKKDLEIVSLDYTKPTFKGFWVKELQEQKKPARDLNDEYIEQEVKYILFPQQAGDIELDPLKIGVTTLKQENGRSYFLSSPTETKAIYSNKLQLKVNELPENVNLVGDFKIFSSVNKDTVKQGEAVSYKLNIEGRGNFDDLDEIKLNIPGVTIYDNPSKKDFNMENGLYGGKYTKSYSVVGQNDFTIPSIELKYFNKESKTIKIIKTKSYKIKVDGAVRKDAKLEVAKTVEEGSSNLLNQNDPKIINTSIEEKIFYFILGFLFAIVLVLINYFMKKQKQTKVETPLLKLVKKAKTKEELFKFLVVYINIDEELDKIIYKLETLPENEYKKEQKNVILLLDKLETKDLKLDTQL